MKPTNLNFDMVHTGNIVFSSFLPLDKVKGYWAGIINGSLVHFIFEENDFVEVIPDEVAAVFQVTEDLLGFSEYLIVIEAGIRMKRLLTLTSDN